MASMTLLAVLWYISLEVISNFRKFDTMGNQNLKIDVGLQFNYWKFHYLPELKPKFFILAPRYLLKRFSTFLLSKNSSACLNNTSTVHTILSKEKFCNQLLYKLCQKMQKGNTVFIILKENHFE